MKRKYRLQAVMTADDVSVRCLPTYLCAAGPAMCHRCAVSCAFGARYLAVQRGEDKPPTRTRPKKPRKQRVGTEAFNNVSVRGTRDAIREARNRGYV